MKATERPEFAPGCLVIVSVIFAALGSGLVTAAIIKMAWLYLLTGRF